MTGSIRFFEKITFHHKITLFVFLKVKLPNMFDWHILPGLKIDVLIACRRLPVNPRMLSVAQDTVPVVIYRNLQQILTLSTPQNSQPYKILTLSLNSNQNFHIQAP